MEYDVKLEPPTLSDFDFINAHVKTEVPNLFENASRCEQHILDTVLSEGNKLSVSEFKDECGLSSEFRDPVSMETSKKFRVLKTAPGYGVLSEKRHNLDALSPGNDKFPLSTGKDELEESLKIEKNHASTKMSNNSGVFRTLSECSVLNKKNHDLDVPLPLWNVEDSSGQIGKNPALPETSNPSILRPTQGDHVLNEKQNMLLNSLVVGPGQFEASPRKVGSNSADAMKSEVSNPTRSAGFCCPVCKKFFRNRAVLKSHISPGPNKLVYKCLHCGDCFLWTSVVLRHLKKHLFSTSRDVTVFEIETRLHDGFLLRYCHKCPFHCLGAKNFLLHINTNHREHCKSDMPYNLESTNLPTNNPTHCNSSASSTPANLMNHGDNSTLPILQHPATCVNNDLAAPTEHIADCSSNTTYCSSDASVATANMANSSCNLPLVRTEYPGHCRNNAPSMSASPNNYSKNTSLSTIVNTASSANKDLPAKTEQVAHCSSNSLPTNTGSTTPVVILLLLPPPDQIAGTNLALQSNRSIPTSTEPSLNNNTLSGENSLNTKPLQNETLMVVDSKQPNEPDNAMVNIPGLLCTVCGDLFSTADTFKAHFRPAPDCSFYCCSLCKAFFKSQNMIRSHIQRHGEIAKILFVEVKRQYHGFKIFWFCDRCDAFFDNGKTLLCHFNTKHCDLEDAGTDGIETLPVGAKVLSFNPAGSRQDNSKPVFVVPTRQSSNNIQCSDMQLITVPEVGIRSISEDFKPSHQNIIDDKVQGGIPQSQTNISMEISEPAVDELNKNVGFSTANAIEDNFQAHHSQNSLTRPPLICELCGKIFRKLFNLKQHMRSHTDEKPFACRLCGKEFSIKVNLKNHEASHNGIKPHQCHLCGKAFTRKHALGRHFLKIHRNSKISRCSYCTKWFTQKLQLDIHLLKKHTAKGFTCELCGRFLAHQTSFTRHMMMHTGKRPHICGKGFARECLCYIHAKSPPS